MCGSRKYPYHPHGRDWIFQAGRGGGAAVNLPNFPVGRGGHHREMRVLVMRNRVTKKKHKNLQQQFICEDIKHNKS